MKWFYKMEYKYGKRAPKNLTKIIVGGQILVWLVVMLAYSPLYSLITLNRPMLFSGQVWRLITFLFVPTLNMNPLFFALEMYIFYLLGTSLERAWGNFKFDAYLLLGIVGAWIACLITGYGSNMALYTSIYFAFAILFPDMQFMLFFVIPVKVKWLGLLAGALYLVEIIFLLLGGQFWQALAQVIGLLSFWVFFGKSLFTSIRDYFRTKKRQREWKNQWRDQ